MRRNVKRKKREEKPEPITGNCCVRLPRMLHHAAKLYACQLGKSLQGWIGELIEKEIKDK
jgi:predicted HicB family RNase H-like nuclease